MRKVLLFAALCLALSIAVPAFADIIVGNPPDPGTGNCFPFGCSYTTNYQQVYSHTQFTGPIDITALQFFNTQVDQGATMMNAGTWTISLSTTTADWNTISGNFNSNLGGDNTQVFSGNLSQPWAFGNTLTINLQKDFMYDPSKGNLLMTVNAQNTSAPGGNIYFDTNGYNGGSFNGNTFLGRVYCNGCGQTDGNVNNGYGLVTGFVGSSSQGTVPEPSSLLLLGTGVAGLAGLRRKLF